MLHVEIFFNQTQRHLSKFQQEIVRIRNSIDIDNGERNNEQPTGKG